MRYNPRANLGREEDYILAAVESDSALTVETVDNHIYFYAPVDDDRCLALIQQLKKLDRELTQERLSRNLPDNFPRVPIWLHINSPGGNPFSAFAVIDQFDKIQSPIWGIAEGATASAATLIHLASNRRFMQKNAYMLIHQLHHMAWGLYTYEQQKDDMVLADMIMDNMADFYVEHSNMTKDDVKKALKRDSWFNAQACLDLGLIEEIL